MKKYSLIWIIALILYFLTAYSYAMQQPQGNQLVGWWRFDEGICASASNCTTADSSGNGYAGTLVGNPSPSWTVGKIGDALSFNGTNQYVNLGNYPALKPTQGVTVSAWVKWASTTFPAIQRIVSGGSKVSETYGYILTYHNDGHIYFDIGNGTSNIGASGPFTPTLNVWYHIVGTWGWNGTTNSNTITIYVNGVSFGTNSVSSILYSTENVTIGADSDGGYPFNGYIDEVRIYNYALPPLSSPSAILDLCLAGGTGYDCGMVGWWKLNGDTLDSSGYGNNGTWSSTSNQAGTNGYYSTGKIYPLAAYLDGTTDVISATLQNVTLSDYTVSFWYNSTAKSSDSALSILVLRLGGTSFYPDCSQWYRVVDPPLNITAGDGSVGSSNLYNVLNTWKLMTVTRSGTTITIYINGVSVASAPATGGSAINPYLDIGSNIYPPRSLIGLLSGVRVYNRALTAKEVLTLYTVENSGGY